MSSNKAKAETPAKKKTQEEKIQDLLVKAKQTLQGVDESYILQNAQTHEFPTFSLSEINVGPQLGVGGFSTVTEVSSFNTIQKDDNEGEDSKKQGVEGGTQGQQQGANGNQEGGIEENGGGDDENDEHDDDHHDDHKHDNSHYDVSAAKKIMEKRCLRYGSARYAIKRLKLEELNELDKTRGMIDLAIEIRYYKALFHPNIVKMRGHSIMPQSDGSDLSKDTFIIMDRLYGTLDDKFDEWKQRSTTIQGSCCGLIGGDKQAIRDLLKDRLLVLYDLTAAFKYLHQNKLVYRDIVSFGNMRIWLRSSVANLFA